MYALKGTRAAFAAAFLSAGAVVAQTDQTDLSPAAKVLAAEDHEWLTLMGRVETVTGDSFVLDYGRGEILVEMDDFDNYNENMIPQGDQVRVTGMIDNDFYQRKTLEASSLHSARLNAYFYANPRDEEGTASAPPLLRAAKHNEWLGVLGKVLTVGNNKILLSVGGKTVTVDTTEMAQAPLVLPGDRIAAYGRVDKDIFAGFEVVAYSVNRR